VVITVEDWAEIRRLHRAEKIPIKEISRRLGVARNTVRAALASDHPPKYERAARGSLVDEVEVEIRKLLKEFPRMASTVIAERIGWEHSITILKDRLKVIRPEYAGIDPADRLVHVAGAATQCDLWFPEIRIPVGYEQTAILPVLAMTLTYSRFISAVMLPSRQAGDLLAGMWQLIAALGAVSKTLVWDLESAIGKGRRVSAPAAMFAGTLGTRIRLLPARDPESKGVIERNNGFFETSFLPGRRFTGPGDFNDQMADWLPRANTRLVRATGNRPVDALAVDLAAMGMLPPLAPVVGLANRVRLARDYYVRVDTNDYSVDPRMIGRLVDVTASPTKVLVFCEGMIVAEHARSWAHRIVITDPAHVSAAKTLRAAFGLERAARERASRQDARRHQDGTPVILRALPDYDTLFGVDFTPAPTLSPEPGSETGLGSVVAVSDEQVDLNACAPAANPVAVSVPVPDPLVFLRDTDAGPAVTAEVIG
jgi:transposase